MITFAICVLVAALGYWQGRCGGWSRCARRYEAILHERDQRFNEVLGDRDRRNMALQHALERLAGIKTYTFPGNIATPQMFPEVSGVAYAEIALWGLPLPALWMDEKDRCHIS